MNNDIEVDFDPKTKRLVMRCPFFLADVMRSFPSRRFNPKDKTWRMALVKGNIAHMDDMSRSCTFKKTDAARDAIADMGKLAAKPVHAPFPHHAYNYALSASGYLPMEHQKKMLDHSWGLRAGAWFAKMGVGKTFAATHLACARFMAGEIDSVVVICPSTLRPTWRKEIAKYATVPYDFVIHDPKSATVRDFYKDKDKSRLKILAVSVEGLGVSGNLYDSVCGFYPGREIFVVCDESSRIKHPDRLRTKRSIELGMAAKYRIILNGTPIAVGIKDLWSQYQFLDPNIIGLDDYWSFKTRYLVMGGFENKQIVGVQHLEELMQLIEPYTVEVGKEVLNLPPKVVAPRYCTASAQQKMLLRLIKQGIDPNIKVDNVLERILRWRQVVGGWYPRYDPLTEEVTLEPLDDNPKMDLLIDMIEDNYATTKFIIWTTFVHEIEYIAARLGEKYGHSSVETYYGKTPMSDRPRIEDRYCNDSTMRFFVANPATAGLGLTLVSGENDAMVYYSGTNAYIDRAQSEDRAHRIGQAGTVLVIDLVMERTVDEAIMASIAEKMSIEEYLMTRLANGSAGELTG